MSLYLTKGTTDTQGIQ